MVVRSDGCVQASTAELARDDPVAEPHLHHARRRTGHDLRVALADPGVSRDRRGAALAPRVPLRWRELAGGSLGYRVGMRTCWWLIVVVALASCSEKRRHRQTGRALAVGTLATRPVPPKPPWPIDTAALLARLQGAWVMRDEQEIGSVAAWDVRGDQVTIWDAKTQQEVSAKLVFDAPCQYQLHFENGYTTGRFVFDGTTLHAGLGDAGVKLDDRLIACTEMGGVVLSGTTCTYHYQYEDVWLNYSVKCSLSGDTLTIRIPRGEYVPELTLHGNVLADDQLWNNTPLHVTSYAEAKAKANAL